MSVKVIIVLGLHKVKVMKELLLTLRDAVI